MSKLWTATLKLPKSTFPPRPLPQVREQYIQRCSDHLYEWQKANRPANNKFVIHDGPPYANGGLHVGHALNKILKDMILRVKVQQGRQVEYTPGWDCHGLPIELKALENSDGKDLTPREIRKTARNLASNTVVKQMKSFRSYGVMADWGQKWTTMDAAFELRQLRLFQKMVDKGLIYRRRKPVYWSPSSKTALAEAELEYKDDHVSTAAWVRFPIKGKHWEKLTVLAEEKESILDEEQQLYAVIWTTTPWTLPANQAIAIHDDLEYVVIRSDSKGKSVNKYQRGDYIVALNRLDSLKSTIHNEWLTNSRILTEPFPGRLLKDMKYINILHGEEYGHDLSIIHADFVSADSGTGLVHLAPGHGFEDYEVTRSLKLDAFAPIDDNGRFTFEAYLPRPDALESAPPVLEGGSEAVIELLRYDVLAVEKYTHKYPYDWRTKKPVIVRATEQWFADVESIKGEALDALKRVQFIPSSGQKRLESFVKGRSEWCISRQRSWGVPIPVLYRVKNEVDYPVAVVNKEIVDHIISVIQQRGTNAWWSDPQDDPAWIPDSLKGGKKVFQRGTDTMDVWFDSGSSWGMMSGQADVYLEGSDQHRGWFQSSLLTRIAAGQVEDGLFVKGAPFKQLITHGFTLDQDGKKMSKSLGNVVGPDQVMDGSLLPPMKRKGKDANGPPRYDALGPDALRLWVASSDYTKDVAIGATVLQGVHTALVKYRTMIKMLLGSMHQSARTAPLTTTDHIALIQLQDTMVEVGKSFDNHEFYKAYNALNRWVTNDLSAFYLEALKDRLYCGDGGGIVEPIFMGFLRMLSPMTPLLVEEAWEHRPQWMKQDSSLVHPLRQLYSTPLIDPGRLTHDLASLRKDIPTLMSVHAAIKAGLENARTDKALGASLQSTAALFVADQKTRALVEKYKNELDSMFVVSSVKISETTPPESVSKYVHEFEANGAKGTAAILPPEHAKCPRCWRYVAPAEDQLCGRCEDIVNKL